LRATAAYHSHTQLCTQMEVQNPVISTARSANGFEALGVACNSNHLRATAAYHSRA